MSTYGRLTFSGLSLPPAPARQPSPEPTVLWDLHEADALLEHLLFSGGDDHDGAVCLVESIFRPLQGVSASIFDPAHGDGLDERKKRSPWYEDDASAADDDCTGLAAPPADNGAHLSKFAAQGKAAKSPAGKKRAAAAAAAAAPAPPDLVAQVDALAQETVPDAKELLDSLEKAFLQGLQDDNEKVVQRARTEAAEYRQLHERLLRASGTHNTLSLQASTGV
jgi:hypothetical protein